jgi:hypothetical protein
MSQFDSKSRKLVYFGGIVLLSIPIIFLGMPSRGAVGSGGKLAKLRTEYDLGEATLGKVDPSSATMNLVLLGLRGVASSVLWRQAIDQQENKDWGGLRATTDSIIMLQPHFLQVWRFQGWNLAYNVSAEWDDVEDRYYWVKEGAKFYQQGTARNEKMPELFWDTGWVIGSKVGNSDEKKYFRQYFKHDPDEEKFGGGPDPQLNPDGLDNYLVAQKWYQRANDLENEPGVEQHIMMRMIFRSYPSKAQFAYARALQDEGQFNEEGYLAWVKAYDMWTKDFGREEFITPAGAIVLEFTDEDLQRLAERDKVTVQEKRDWTDRYQQNVSYRYWRLLASAESEQLMRDAHRNIYDGKYQFYNQKFVQSEEDKEKGYGPETWGAAEYLEKGMSQMEQVFRDYEDLTVDDSTAVENAMLAVLYYRNIYEARNLELPEDYPLKGLWEQNQGLMPDVELMFRRESREFAQMLQEQAEATE